MITSPPTGRTASARVLSVGIGTSCVGVAALLVSYFSAVWFSSAGVGSSTFRLMHDAHFLGAHRLDVAYWHWLGYAVMAATVALTAAATAPTRVRRRAGVLAAGAGAAGIVLTVVALFTRSTPAAVLHYSDVGVYLALVGYACCAAGALITSRRGSAPVP